MKSITLNSKEKFLNMAKNYSLKIAFIKLMCFISGILVSRGAVLGRYYPFGLSFSASAPGSFFAPTLIGAAMGYLFPLRLGPAIRYISTIVAIAAAKWTLSDLYKIKKHFLYTPLVVFFSALVTGFAMDFAYGIDGLDIFISILEATVAAGTAYFFDNTFKIIANKKIYSLGQKDFVCLAVSLSIILFSVSQINIGGVSLGRVLGITATLITSYVVGAFGGALVGAAMGAIFSLSFLGVPYTSNFYPFGGMISGLFSPFGRIGVCLSFLLSAGLTFFPLVNTDGIIICTYELILGSLLFLVIPKKFIYRCRLFLPKLSSAGDDGGEETKRFIIQKIKFLSKFLCCVPKIIENASNRFLKKEETSPRLMCLQAAANHCVNCGKNEKCWSENFDSTEKNIINIYENVSKNKEFMNFNLSTDFLQRCYQTDSLTKEISKFYNNLRSEKNSKLKIMEFKNIISEQFSAVGSLLKDLTGEFSEVVSISEKLSVKIKNEFKNLNIKYTSVNSFVDRNGKIFLEIECSYRPSEEMLYEIYKVVSKVSGRKMNMPVLCECADVFKIKISEKKIYSVSVGVSQHTFNNGRMCGDSCRYFEDGFGIFNVFISDGMGTGVKAAAEGSMTAELMKNFVKSGVSVASAIKFVNSALLLRSGDESLTTIDALSLNLLTGEAKFIKAGAPTTFLLRDNEVKKISFETLPIGILNEASFSEKVYNLKNGDIILMVSDGATDIGSEFIENILKSKIYNSAQELAKMVVNEAINLRKETHDDDISAVAIHLYR
ncbi:MAG: SpoIIE family protein phosphatase [Clostridia bacterium]|nr:SpoIIE family protein phosphatase [Clostridia bacterium]